MRQTERLRTRFAPSPTGKLHLGHAFAASVAYHEAHHAGGDFLLRYEDLDRSRVRPHFYSDQWTDLEWLGFLPDQPPWRQSERLAVYRDFFDRLKARDLVYPCFCSRKDSEEEHNLSIGAPHGARETLSLYKGTCRELSWKARDTLLSQGKQSAWRLRAEVALSVTGALSWHERGHGEQTVDQRTFGDVVLWRKDDYPAYHLSVVIDDEASGVGLVTRGHDLFAATSIHRLLQALFGFRELIWHHHDLIVDEKGNRLAKRHDALALSLLRAQGLTPSSVLGLADRYRRGRV